ncbi:ribulose-phosphate 3 epimerase family protein, partial [Vibrio parahaemolyticus VP2007-007]
ATRLRYHCANRRSSNGKTGRSHHP